MNLCIYRRAVLLSEKVWMLSPPDNLRVPTLLCITQNMIGVCLYCRIQGCLVRAVRYIESCCRGKSPGWMMHRGKEGRGEVFIQLQPAICSLCPSSDILLTHIGPYRRMHMHRDRLDLYTTHTYTHTVSSSLILYSWGLSCQLGTLRPLALWPAAIIRESLYCHYWSLAW